VYKTASTCACARMDTRGPTAALVRRLLLPSASLAALPLAPDCDSGAGASPSHHRAESCPNACNHRGTCTRGMCLCDAAWGGPDCAVDRLVLLQDELMEGVPIEMDFQVHAPLPEREREPS
jgi:hypothetical protein